MGINEIGNRGGAVLLGAESTGSTGLHGRRPVQNPLYWFVSRVWRWDLKRDILHQP